MDTQDESLQTEIEGGIKGEATPPEGTPPEGGAETPPEGTPPSKPEEPPKEPAPAGASPELVKAEVRAAVAEARADWEKEEREKGDQTPKPDFLQEAIDALPEEQKEIAKDLKPVLEKIASKESYVSKEDAAKMAEQATEDAVNIAHLENWKGKMSQEWDGKDGKPKFDWEALDKFMQEKDLTDPEDAFWLMNKEALITHAASVTKKPEPTVDKGGGKPPPSKPPEEKPLTEKEAVERHTEKAEERLKAAGL